VVLVDAIIGSILLGVSLVALLGLAARAMSAQATGEQLQTAAMLADEQLSLVLARGPDNYSSSFDVEGPCEAPYEAYAFRLEFAGGAGGDPYTVTVTISWTAGGRDYNEAVQTLIAPRLGDEPDPERRPDQPVNRYY
jgi:Tfp pilus assembly protein PilV